MIKLSEPGASLYHLNTIPFRIGEPHELNLAIKYPEQPFFYAFNNDSYNYAEWENPGYRLEGEIYEVIVRLVGANLNEEHHFTLKNLGPGNGLELTPPAPQS
jgi:hypothetical protein